jgi:HAE1 family hydrophobic/amphiphilic exporter-1
VVVLENIFRFKEEGDDGPTSSVKGAQEVATPVVISTLTTLVVFLPVLFVPGIAGLLFRDLALTISFALIVSVLVALTIIPVLSSKLFQKELEGDDDRSVFKKLKDYSSSSVRNLLLAIPLWIVIIPLYPIIWLVGATKRSLAGGFGGKIEPFLTRQLDRLERSYNNALNKSLKRSGLVVLASFILLLASLPIYLLLGGEFFPEVDENNIVLEVQREPGVNLFELERTVIQMEDVIRNEVPEARLIVSDYGDKTGIEGADNPGGNQGVVRVELVPVDERARGQFEITASLLESMQNIPGANIKELREDPLSPDGETGLIVQIFGYAPDVRQDLAAYAIDGLRETDGIASVFSSADQGRPELRIQMDRERISRVGLNTSQVATAVSNAVRGDVATTFVDEGVEFEVLVQLSPEDRSASDKLEDIQIQTAGGTWMPLDNLARIERFTGPSSILRINQERMLEIEADLAGLDLQTATERARSVLNQINWPEGYRYEVAGSAEDQAESFQYLVFAFLIAGILTYMVMASQFESLVEPLIIIVTIPLALTGVLLMLWITSTPISVTAMVGLVLLTGIVVNNGIVMIDYIKILQARGIDRLEAIANGATRRLRPILMTALTTILAMVPLALQLGSGSETWSPMARTVIGGLTMSTFLMLFAVPSMYYIVNSWVEGFGFNAVHKEDPLNNQES